MRVVFFCTATGRRTDLPSSLFSLSAVFQLMADRTKCDHVVECIVAQLAPFYLMVYLQVLGGTAVLAPPPVAFEHLVTQ